MPKPLKSAHPALLAVLCGWQLFSAPRLTAAPAAPDAVATFTQPNGTQFRARLVGDENFGYYSAEGGRPVQYDPESHWWYYTDQEEAGSGGVVSDRRVGVDAPPGPAWKPRPTAEELERLRGIEYKASVPTTATFRNRPTRGKNGVTVNARLAMLLTNFAAPSAADPSVPDATASLTTSVTKETFESSYFGTSDANALTMSNLFAQMSYNQHLVSSGPAGIQDWVRAPKLRSYYGDSTPYADARTSRESAAPIRELSRWRAAAADATFDFGPYDTDNDDFVDLVCVLYQGMDQTSTGQRADLWPIRFALNNNTNANDPGRIYITNDVNAAGRTVKVRDCIIVPEQNRAAAVGTIGLLCHEYGHGIGWPDLYDIDGSTAGVGAWCLMGSGNWNRSTPTSASGDSPCWANAWCRIQCGWLVPQNPTYNDRGYRIPEAKRENFALKLSRNGAGGPEYFLVENRQRTGWDQGLPGGTAGPASGLMIWHIDDTQTTNANEWWSIPGTGGLTGGGNRLVALEQADRLFQLDQLSPTRTAPANPGNSGDGGDLFTSGSSFTDTTVPSSRMYSGTPTNVAVRNISAASATDASITADIYMQADQGFPEVVTMNPADGLNYYTIPSLVGTVRDDVGLSSVQVALLRRRPSGDEWYNWTSTSWQAAYSETSAALSGSGNTRDFSRGITVGHVTPGAYSFFAKAIDTSAAGSGWRESRFTVLEDPNGPDVTISEPSNWENYPAGVVPNFAGTAVNTTATNSVEIAMKKDSGAEAGRFYDWTNNTWSAAGAYGAPNVYLDSGANWVVNMAPRPLGDGNYTLFARVISGDTRISPWRAVAFRVGRPFRVTITSPGHQSGTKQLTEFSGAVDDPSGTGLTGSVVTLTLTDPGGRNWNGSAWVTGTATFTAPAGNGSWTSTAVPADADLPSGMYALTANASTNGGESTTLTAGVNAINFYMDRAVPAGAVTSPVHNSVITTPVLPPFRGTASDANGIAWVNCFIRRNSDQAYWNGSSWTEDPTGAPQQNPNEAAPPVAFLSASYTAATDEWVCTSPLPAPGSNMRSGSYSFIVIPGDSAGNYFQTESTITVDFHQTYTWTGATLRDADPTNNSTHWGTPENWSPVGVPDVEDVAVISNGDTVDSSISRTVHGLQLSSGMLNFTNGPGPLGTLTTKNASAWTGGTMNGIWENEGTITVSGAGPKALWDNAVLNNRGTIIWNGEGPIQARAATGTGAVINNKPGGIFRIAGAGQVFTREYGSRRPVFNNENGARLERDGSGGFATLTIWEFQNAGEIRAQTGILTFQDGAFDGYDLFLNPGTTLTGAAYLRINNATQLNTAVHAQCSVEMVDNSWLGCPGAPGVAKFDGTFNWWGGVIFGNLTIGSAGVLNVTDIIPATPVVKQLWDDTTLDNDGTIHWTGGAPIRARASTGTGAVINNRSGARFYLDADGTVFAREYGSRIPVFNNLAGGTFHKTAGAGNAAVDTFAFNHRGGMVCDAGTMSFFTAFDVASTTPWTGAGDFELHGGDVTITGLMQLNGPSFTILNGSLWGAVDGTGALGTAAGSTIEWKNGTFLRTLRLTAGSTLNLSGPNPKVLWDDAVLDNDGTVTWQGGGPLRARASTGAGAVVNNRSGARFEAAADGDVFAREYSSRIPLFNNLAGAVFARTAGEGTASVHSYHFNNDSAITSQTGVLAFNTVLNLHDGGTLNGAGRFEMPGGTVNVTGGTSLTGTSFSVLAGDIVGLAGAVWNSSSGGAWRWLGGTLSGTMELSGGSTLHIADPPGATAVKSLWDNAVLNNHGTIEWSGASPIRARASTGVGSIVANRPGAVFRVLSDGPLLTREYTSRMPRFIIESGAQCLKPAGDAAVFTTCDWLFENAGTVNVGGGTVDLLQGGDSSGTFTATGGGVLRFRGGSHTLRSGVVLNGNGRIQVDGGTVLGAGDLIGNTTAPGAFELLSGTLGGTVNYAGAGLLHWAGGTLAGILALAPGTRADLDGPAVKYMWDDAVLNNSGTVTWHGTGAIQARASTGAGAVVNNASGGIFRIAADGDVFSREYGNRRPIFYNRNGGRFEKSGGSGASTCSVWEFHSAGEMRCVTGTFSFVDGPYDGYDLFLEPGASLTGTGRLRLQTATHLTTSVHAQCPVDLPEPSWLGCPPPAEGNAPSRFEGLLNWTGGVIWGELVIGPAGIVQVSDAVPGTPVPKQLWDDTTLHNEGMIQWLGGGTLRARASTGTGAVINNRTGASFQTAADGVVFGREYASRIPVFNNLAGSTFRKTAGTGNTAVDTFAFNHRGGMVCDSGTISFFTALDVASVTPWTGAGDFELHGGDVTITGVMQLNGPSFTILNGNVWGAVDGTGAFGTTAGGSIEWQNGTFLRTLRLTAGSTMNLTGPAVKALWDDAVLENDGSIVWHGGGPLRARAATGAGAVLNNRTGGSFHAASGGEVLAREYASRVPVFQNAGSVRIGLPVAACSFNGWSFTQVAGGVIHADVAGPAVGEFDSLSVNNGTATLAGTLSATKLNGYSPATGTSFGFLTAGTVSGTFGIVTGGFSAEYTGTTATLRAGAAAQTFDQWAASKGLTGANALPGADPDKDGYSNFFEYVHNMSPTAASGPPDTTGAEKIGGQEFLTLKYRRYDDREAAGVTYTPQTGPTLGNWGTAGIIEEVDPTAPVIPGSTACRCRVPITPNEEKFLRVKAVKP